MSRTSGCPWRQDFQGELSRVRSVASGCCGPIFAMRSGEEVPLSLEAKVCFMMQKVDEIVTILVVTILDEIVTILIVLRIHH